MEDDKAKEWAAAFIESAVQRFLGDADFYEAIEDQAFEAGSSDFTEGSIDQVMELIDDATCTIEVDWPPRVKGRVER